MHFMRARDRLVLASLCGLVLAAITHISVILAIPHMAQNDAFSRLSATANGEKAELIAKPGTLDSWPPDLDPNTATGACAYTLEDGPVRIMLRSANLPQILSFHAKGGGVFFAITDKAALKGVLEVVIVTKAQLDKLKSLDDEEAPSRDIRILAPLSEGLAIIRALALFPSQREEAETLVQAMSCTVDAMNGKAE
jgi:uncharacterized membrane protein